MAGSVGEMKLARTGLLTFVLGGAVLSVSGDPLTSRPLAAPSGGATGTSLFKRISAEVAGLGDFSNRYLNPEMWSTRWADYMTGAAGTGVAIGDVNGDDRPDLFLVSKDETSRLYLNCGDFKFEDVTDQAGFTPAPGPASGVTFADVDNDGDLDLFRCFVNAPNQLWVNDGIGHFTEAAKAWGVDVVSGGNVAAFADYDRDGDLDLYLQNNHIATPSGPAMQADQFFVNTGSRFVDRTEEAGLLDRANGHAVTWWDYDDDGWLDLFIANDFAAPDRLFRNQGDGTFRDVLNDVLPLTPYSSMGSDFGDINNDGRWDLWATDMETPDRAKRHRTALDLVITHAQTSSGTAFQYEKNALLLQTSPGQFTDIAFLAGLARTEWTWAARLADLDNDGWLDALAVNGMIRQLNDKDMGARSLRMSGPHRMARIFRPGEPLRERNLAYRNRGDLTFEEMGARWGLDHMGISFGAAFSDLDGDGDLDLVVNNYDESPGIYRNDEALHQRITVALHGTQSNRFGVGAKVTVKTTDFSQTKMLQPTRGYLSSDQPILHFGLGEADQIDSLSVVWPNGTRQEFSALATAQHYTIKQPNPAAEIPSTGRVDALFSALEIDWPDEATRTEAATNEFAGQPLLPFRQSDLGGRVVAGDINGDGQVDLVLSGASGQAPLVLNARSRSKFESELSLDLEDDFLSEDSDLALFDADGDGDLDLFVSSGGVELAADDAGYADRLYLNEEGEFLRDFDQAFPHSSSRTIAPGDFNADGDQDLLIVGGPIADHYPHSYPSTLWVNHDGSFQAAPHLAPGLADQGRVDAAEWADLDRDGDLDLILLGEWNSPQIWRNAQSILKPDTDAVLPNHHRGLWTSLAVADLDADGRLDIVAGNLGLNSDYDAGPLRLRFMDDRMVSSPLVETVIDGDQEYPLRERWLLAKEFPIITRRVRTHASYGEKTFSELIPRAEEFAAATIDEVRSGVFWQQSDGRFTFVPLPSFAQSGRAMDIAIVDGDGDGRRDIILSLQPHYPDPWSGNIERGHLTFLRNLGDRKFEAMLPGDSGLVMDGNPRGLTVTDLDADGHPVLIVARRDGTPIVFRLGSPTP